MVDITAESLGTVFGAVVVVAGAILYAKAYLSNIKLKEANNEAGVAVAASQETVFNMVTNQLDALRREVEAVRNELNEERKHNRLLQAHIYKLEATMRNHNIDPPVFEITLSPSTAS